MNNAKEIRKQLGTHLETMRKQYALLGAQIGCFNDIYLTMNQYDLAETNEKFHNLLGRFEDDICGFPVDELCDIAAALRMIAPAPWEPDPEESAYDRWKNNNR